MYLFRRLRQYTATADAVVLERIVEAAGDEPFKSVSLQIQESQWPEEIILRVIEMYADLTQSQYFFVWTNLETSGWKQILEKHRSLRF